MKLSAPHFLLLCETKNSPDSESGRWSFVLEELGGSFRIEADEDEPGVVGERLQLLSVVRGLEALEQPSTVTLVTSSDYVGRGIRHNLSSWKENGFQWERFGEMVSIKNRDLWVRVERAFNIHSVMCRVWNFENSRIFGSLPLSVRPQSSTESTFERWELESVDEEPIKAVSAGSLSKPEHNKSDKANTVEFGSFCNSVAS